MLLKDTKTDQGRWCSHACACRVSALSSACTRWMWCRTSSIGISGFVLTIAGRIFRCPAFTSSPSSVFRWTPDFCTDMHTSRYSKKARADTHSHGLPKKWRESVRRRFAETNCRYEASAAAASWQANDGGRQRKTACPLLYRYRLTHTARSLACPLLTLSSSAPSFSNCIFRSDGAPCARPLPPSSDRSAGQRNQTSHITVLARPVCQFVRVIDPPSPAGFLMIAHLSRLASFSDIFGAWFGVWDWIHSHTPPRTRSPSSPPSFHTLSLSPEFTSVWWSV